jgi:hypothetical protein
MTKKEKPSKPNILAGFKYSLAERIFGTRVIA